MSTTPQPELVPGPSLVQTLANVDQVLAGQGLPTYSAMLEFVQRVHTVSRLASNSDVLPEHGRQAAELLRPFKSWPGADMDPIAYDKYQEHLAHSAPCSSAWDGFDRGDDDHDLVDVDLDTDFVQVLDPELHALLIELNNLHDSHVLAWRAATGQDDIDF